MGKRITVKDVAKEAGVSVATVSYVMNDRKDQKISEATRKKVLQIANLLNYHPSQAAVSLATGKTNVIGVAYALDANVPSRNMEINNFVNMLIERMNRMNYDILYVPVSDDEESIRINRAIDAIIAIDLTHEQFKSLSGKYFVPVINVEMIVDDDLFYQIYTDYPSLIAQAQEQLGGDAYLVLDKYENEKFHSFIVDSLPPERVITMSTVTAKEIEELSGKKVIILGTLLALMLQPYIQPENQLVIISEENEKILPASIPVLYNNTAKKANLTMNILLNALNHNFDLNHDCKVR